ncbi:hypothetical protein O6H91_17G063900 [Diphasiastrum complanatum]|uniref:Uncharacterized protein n=1 Tax=Diphasiastrum complanatum TaxID=34168 RepID=A0ACC2B7K0_DIPCM|nr:hypothetical protein O6H91_17G063900 [Diphasiastrum complanatum]
MSSASSDSPTLHLAKRKLRDDIVLEEDNSKRPHRSGNNLQLEEWNVPADTMVALRLMCDQFPKLEKAFRKQGTIRVFKLNTGQDDFAIMLLDNYLFQLESAKKRMESKHGQDPTLVFDWFLTNVINTNTQVSITHSELVMLLSKGGPVADKHISLLINAGLLVRQLADETTYWFSIPNVGPILKSLTQGRKELLYFLSRRRYKEIFLSQFEKRGLRTSSLGVQFHIRDLLGSGKIHVVHNPIGLLIRLAG